MKLGAHRVGRKRPAWQPRPLDRTLAFFDLLLACTSRVVNDPLGRARQVGDDKADARIKLARMPLDFGDSPGAASSSFRPDS